MSDALARLAAALGLGERPDEVQGAMAALYAGIDLEVSARARDKALPCHAGCDACCHEAVFVSAPEFFVVAAELLLRFDAAARRALVAEMERLAERFEDELLLLEALPPGPERDEVAVRVRFRCPLLDGAGRCSVYAARELNARTFGASWDEAREEAYGCELTHARLRVLGAAEARTLAGARAARRRLIAALAAVGLDPPGGWPVHLYPWWFRAHGALLCEAP